MFLEHPYTEYIESEIQKIIGMSRAGVNLALRGLVKTEYIIRRLRGKTYFYSLQRVNPVIKQLKVLTVIHFLLPLISKLKEISNTIILYGSSARGEDHEDSNIDLFLISHSKGKITNCINKFKSKLKRLLKKARKTLYGNFNTIFIFLFFVLYRVNEKVQEIFSNSLPMPLLFL